MSDGLVEAAQEQLFEQLSPAYRFTRGGLKIDGVPFDLTRYPFLHEMYDEMHPRVVVRKAAQLGLTSWAIVTVIERMRTMYDRGVLYAFPTDLEVSDFSQARFDRLLKENPLFFDGLVHTTDKITLKRIREAYLYFTGMKSRSQLLSKPIDLIVLDEVNEMAPSMVDLAMQRISGSDYGHVIKIGHPSIPEYGIDLDWLASDQRVWKIRCNHCGTETCLEASFPDCLSVSSSGKVYRACDKCRREIHVSDGDWVATAKPKSDSEPITGYWPSQLLSPTVAPETILDEFEEATNTGRGLQTFMNMVLGAPYAELDDAISTEQVIALCNRNIVEHQRHPGPTMLGADVGGRDIMGCVGHRPYGDVQQVIRWFQVKSFDELYDIGEKFNVRVGVIDSMAESRAVRDFCNRAKWAWGCRYSDASTRGYKWDHKSHTVTVNRTESLDGSHASLVGGRIQLPRQSPWFVERIAPQIANLARAVSTNEETGAQKATWIVRGTKNDHFRHAVNYLSIAADRVPLSNITKSKTRRSKQKPRGGWMGV